VATDDVQPGRINAEALEKRRPTLIRFCLSVGVLVVVTLSWVTWDLAHSSSSPAIALLVLALVFGATLLGAFLVGRRRQRTIRASHASDVVTKGPAWVGPVLGIIPGFVLVGSQLLGRSSSLASDMLGLLAAYGLTWMVGLSLGLIVTV